MDDAAIRQLILSQYRAGLKMLEHAIEMCPNDLWIAETHLNRFWHIAYHSIFYTHLYVQVSEADFRPWAKHIPDSQFLGSRPGASDETPAPREARAKSEVREYFSLCRADVEKLVPVLDLEAPSGFYWLPFNKLELQFYNIRHLGHHVGQLADRLRPSTGAGLPWVGAGK